MCHPIVSGGMCGWYNDGYPACASAYAVAAGGPLILGAPAPAHPTAPTHDTRLTLVHHIGQQHSEVLLLLKDLVIHYLHLITHTVSLSHTHLTHTSEQLSQKVQKRNDFSSSFSNCKETGRSKKKEKNTSKKIN